MKRALIAGWLVLVAALGARAQGVRYDNQLLSGRGLPVAGANVEVCTISTPAAWAASNAYALNAIIQDSNGLFEKATTAGTSGTTQPTWSKVVGATTADNTVTWTNVVCTPAASIWSDRAETVAVTNPTTTSGLGNYGWFASPGSYFIEVYGSGLTTQVYTATLPCDASLTAGAAGACGGNIALPVSIANGGCNATTAVGCLANLNGAGKPATSDAVQYVSPNGLDTNDGLSWGTAKGTLGGAQAALAGPGTIYVAAGTYVVNSTTTFTATTQIICAQSQTNPHTSAPSGTTFKGNGTFSGFIVTFDSHLDWTNARNSKVRGCNFDGAGHTASGILAIDTFGLVLEDVYSFQPVVALEQENTNGLFTEGTNLRNINIYDPSNAGILDVLSGGTASLDNEHWEGVYIQLLNATASGFVLPSTMTMGNSTINELKIWGVSNSTETGVSWAGAGDGTTITGMMCEFSGTPGAAKCFDGTSGTNPTLVSPRASQASITYGGNWGTAVPNFSFVAPAQVLGKTGNTPATPGFSFRDSQATGIFDLDGANTDFGFTVNGVRQGWISTNGWHIEPNGASGFNYILDNAGIEVLAASDAFHGIINRATLTATQTYTLPATGGTFAITIASGAAIMTTAAIAAISGSTVTCGATVTVAASGVLTTDTITLAPNAAEGTPNTGLRLSYWPTAGNVNFAWCNPTASSQTPVAETLNWRVVR